MTRIVIDRRTRAQLNNLQEPLQFIDESGQPLGLFTPSAPATLLKPQISEDEIQKRLARAGGRPLADILRDLQARS